MMLKARLIWIFGCAAFAALLSLVIGNTPLGIATAATAGAVAGAVITHLKRL